MAIPPPPLPPTPFLLRSLTLLSTVSSHGKFLAEINGIQVHIANNCWMPSPRDKVKNIDWWADRYWCIFGLGYELPLHYKRENGTLPQKGWSNDDGHTTVSTLFSCYQY